jgi:tripartite ATP-independent transporter DctM subunit
MIPILLAVFAASMATGMPIAFTMGFSALAALALGGNIPLTVVPQRIVVALDSFALMAVPLFILAGQLMNYGGITKRIIGFSNALVGHIRGGLSHVNVVASMIFAGVSGSSTADAAGIGSVLVPAMIKEGYDEDWAIDITAASSTIGPIIPPSILMVIYGSITQLSIGRLFLAGLIPGVAIGLALILVGYVLAVARHQQKRRRSSYRELWTTFVDAIPALMAPFIILFGITSGVFTATEAGVVAALYALAIGVYYREITWHNLYETLLKVAKNTTVVLFIIACASSFGWILAREQLPQIITATLISITQEPTILLLLIILVILLIGLFVEGLAAMMIFVPILVPVANSIGYDPMHFAIIMIICIQIGAITPPVGMLLFVTCSASGLSMGKVGSLIWLFVGGLLTVLLLIVFIPEIATFLPYRLLG